MNVPMAHSGSPLSVPAAPASPAADAELARAAVAGDADAFAGLVHLHSRRVFQYLCHLTRNPHDAQDLSQQTFLKAQQHLDRFDCERPFLHWLLTIARRTALNHFRAQKKWAGPPEDIAASDPSPARVLEQAERTQGLWERARALLSPREYEVLWLRIGEELSTAETARVTGLTQIHVKVLVHRARQRLLKGDLPS